MEKIKRIFENRQEKPIGKYKKSAVMILLTEENGEIYILFEKRAITLKRQPGDICFPGGSLEKNEEPIETAIRETMEELNVQKSDIEIIGNMDYMITPYFTIIYPFVGKLNTNIINPSKEEVDHVFKVPLSYFIKNEPKCYKGYITQKFKEDFPFHLIEGGKKYKFSKGYINQYFYNYKNYIIWGFTARIIKSFIEIITE